MVTGKWIRNAILLVLLVAGANVLFFRELGAVGILFAWALVTVYSLGVRRDTPKYAGLLPTLGAITAFTAVLSASLLLRANPTVQMVLTASLFACTAILVYIMVTGIPFVRSLLEAFFVPFSLLGSYLSALVDGLTKSLSGKSSALLQGAPVSKTVATKIMTVFAGLVVGIPVSGVLLFLLTQADPIFAKAVDTFVKSLSLPEFGPRILLTLFVTVAALPVMGLRIKREFTSPGVLFERSSLVSIMNVVMVLVGFVLGVFLIVQAPYVFVRVAHEVDLSTYGVATYSEYTKRGFAELLTVTVLVYCLVWLGLLGLRGKKSSGRFLLGLNTLVLVELGIFILSVARRIRLYWNFHGLSLIRVYGGFFLFIIAAFTLTLLARHYFKKRWVIAEALFVGIALVIFGWWNAEQFIVYNHPPTVNGWVDAVYLSRMSPDGYDGWNKAFVWAEKVLNDPVLASKGILTGEDRRVISYAGMVTGMLTRHYHDLILTYGSKDEWRQYHKDIFALQRGIIDDFVPRANAELALLQQKGSTVSGQLDPIFMPYSGQGGRSTTIQSTLSDLEKSRAWITEEEQVLKGMADDKLKTKAIRFTPLRNLTRFSDGLCGWVFWDDSAGQPWCVPSFFATTAHENGVVEFPSDFDSFFAQNIKDKEVYGRMKNEIPYTSLFELQKKYITLYYRIIAQPENERGYQLDISLDAPFVERL